jgi:hypothetical protein
MWGWGVDRCPRVASVRQNLAVGQMDPSRPLRGRAGPGSVFWKQSKEGATGQAQGTGEIPGNWGTEAPPSLRRQEAGDDMSSGHAQCQISQDTQQTHLDKNPVPEGLGRRLSTEALASLAWLVNGQSHLGWD